MFAFTQFNRSTPRRALLLALAACCLPLAAAPTTAGATSVTKTLARLQQRHEISKRKENMAVAAYDLARAVKHKVHGKRRKAMAWQIRMVERMARRHQIDGDRVTPLFVTLGDNAKWFRRNGPRPQGTDRRFAGSRIIFEYFTGMGWQFHPLSNFAKLNAIWTVNTPPSRRAQRAYARELVSWGVHRGKALVWEYYFPFGGSPAPYISSISQGTAIQALARVAFRMHNKQLKRAARRGLLAFETPATTGVRLRRDGGFHYLGYSGNKHYIILNMFLQAIDAIHDYALITNDRQGRVLYKRGVAAALKETPEFDTGSWSLYSLGGEKSTVAYHELTITFLGYLCDDTHDAVFCDTRDRFQKYLDDATK